MFRVKNLIFNMLFDGEEVSPERVMNFKMLKMWDVNLTEEEAEAFIAEAQAKVDEGAIWAPFKPEYENR